MAQRSCWKCQKTLGLYLNTANKQEAFCESCLVWCTKEALLHHGPISNTPAVLKRRDGRVAPALSAYPVPWQRAYRESEPAFLADIEAGMPRSQRGLAAMNAFYKVLTGE